MDVSESDLEEISLDLYELRYFHGYPSLHKHLLDPMKALPTATHSWGSQVKSCSCGCRKGGFSLARLEEKGLYGVITPTGGEEQCGANLYCKCRHLHACEIALANGLHPSHVGHTKGQCRLEMAGVGQMASPFQGAWVLANVLKDIHLNAFPLKSFQEPMDVMQTMAIELLRARDELLGYPKHTPSNEIFHQAIQQWGQSNPLPAQVPSQTTATVDAASEQKLFEAKHPSKNPDASEAGLGSASHTPGPVDAHRPDVTIDATKGAEPVNNAPSLEPKAQKKLASETGVGTTSVASEATVQGFVHSSDASDCTDHVNRAPPVEPKARSQKAFEAGVGKTPEASAAADQGFKHRSYAVDCTEQMHSAPTVEPKAHILQASEAGVGKAHEASVVYDPGLVHSSDASDCTDHVNRAPPLEPKARSQKAFEAGVGKTPEASEAADQGFKHRSYAVDCTEQKHSAPTVEPKAHILQASEAGVGKAHEASVVYDPGLVHSSDASDCTDHVNRAPPLEPKAQSQKAFEAGVGKTPEASEAADQGFKHRSYAVDCTEQKHSAPTVEPKAHNLQASEAGVGKAHEASVVYDPGLVHCSHAVDCTEMDGHECKKAARPSVQNFRTTNAKGAEVIRVAVPTQAARFARSANASVHKPDVTAAGSLQTNPRQSTAWPGEVEGNGKQQKPTKPGLGPVMPSTLMPPPQHPDAMPLPRLGCGGPSHVNEPNQGKSQSVERDPPDHTMSQPGMTHIQNLQQAWSGSDDLTEEETRAKATNKRPQQAMQRLQVKAQKEDKAEPYQHPPAPPHAKPLPRLGCGGPSQDDRISGGQRAESVAETKGKQPIDQLKIQTAKIDQQAAQALDPTSQRPAEQPIADQMNSGNVNKTEKPMAPTRDPCAKPLPRLGCGGPTQLDDSSDIEENPEKLQPLAAWNSITGGLNAFANVRNPNQAGSQQSQVDPWAGKTLPVKRKKEEEETSKKKISTDKQPTIAVDTDIYDTPSQRELDAAIIRQLDQEEGQDRGPQEDENVKAKKPKVSRSISQDGTNQHDESQGKGQVVHVAVSGESIFTHAVGEKCTAANLATAVAKMHMLQPPIRVSTAMGTQISQNEVLKQGHFLLLESNGDVKASKCPQTTAVSQSPGTSLIGLTREQALWKQKGWVADDEMDYYMYMLESYHPGSTYGVVHLPDNPDRDAMLVKWILAALTQAHQDINSQVKVLVFLHKEHWIPCFVEADGDVPRVHVPCIEYDWIIHAFQEVVAGHAISFTSSPMPHAFEADCGFQAVGWMLAKLIEDETTQPFTVRQACQWRSLFHQNLQYTGKSTETISTPIRLGGGIQVREQLQQLVVSHGVHPQRGLECADQLIQALGAKVIQQILQSPKPWMDLKSRANLHQPPIRVVLADELKQVIQMRSKENKPVGNKQNKTKGGKQQKAPMQLTADQLCIPPAVFRQEDGQEVGQIHAHQLGSGCKGVVLVNIAEAIPYFGLSKPVSQFGVALLILDHHDPRLPSNCPITKVPAKCVATGEPLIVSAAVLQIGQQEVVRNTPSQCLEVPEVSNSVVRVQVYKDQSTADWDEFIQKPVKHLLSLKPFSEVASGDILDVWDRQYMTMRLTRVPVQEAQLFMVNIRVEATALPTIMQANGQEGRYFEVRTSDGRHPDEEHKTIWLPGKTFAEAQLLQRTSTIAASLVRQGDRYGLRTDKSKAEELHKIHRPDLVYIPGEELRRYKVGPMPFGSTKQSLVHIFQKWNWSARPIGPHAQAGDME